MFDLLQSVAELSMSEFDHHKLVTERRHMSNHETAGV
jgi:hypothetical protein